MLWRMDVSILTVISIIVSIVVPIVATVIACTLSIHRSLSRLDADRRAIQARFDTAMDTFRTEMQRLAERQSHVEGWRDAKGSAAD